MILTITPNPSLDLLYEADRLAWDDANRVPEPRRRPGGQGINVARAASALGASVCAIALLGGSTGDELRSVLEQEGTPLRTVPTRSPTRVFIAIREREGAHSLLLNSPGPVRDEQDADRLLAAIDRAIRETRPAWVACCGSLPPGFSSDFYAAAGRLAREAGSRFVPDCDGEPLRLAAHRADLLVPNHHEAARLLGLPPGAIHDPHGAAAAALRIGRRFDVPVVALTLGPDGAVLAADSRAWHATPPRQRGIAVGAGDAFLAGLLIHLDQDPPADALRHAAAAGAAVLAAGASTLIDAELVPQIHAATHVGQIAGG